MKPLSKEKQKKYNEATICCICHNENRPFDPDQYDWRKVRDHDHVTGYFIGAARNLCNKRRRVLFQIPCFMHNLRGYDSHLIVQGFTMFSDRKIRVIGKSMEEYMEISWGANLVFRDSFQHLSFSLERLVESLLKVGVNKFVHLAQITESLYGTDNIEEKNKAFNK